MKREQQSCSCQEIQKMTYKINALKRVLSDKSLALFEPSQESLQGLNNLSKLLKPKFSLNYGNISKAISRNQNQERKILTSEL